MAYGVGVAHNLQAQWARLLLGSFADVGVREVVVSPGSRSTPFVLAAIGHPELRCHDVVDERAAAYFALGIARRQGRPALLICTSGTAGANYLPAVIEAGASHLPLLVLTADRPVELAHCAANQTIDQLKLYGDHARRFFDLGLADANPRALRALRRVVAQGVAASLYPLPGAVHFNARARKPLEPPSDAADAECALEAAVDRLLERPIVRPALPPLYPNPDAVAALAESCRRELRGLIVVGPRAVGKYQTTAEEWAELARLDEEGHKDEDLDDEPADQGGLYPVDDTNHQGWCSLVRLAEALGFPVLVDPASQLRYRGSDPQARPNGEVARHMGVAVDDLMAPRPPFVDTFDALLRQERVVAGLVPRLILQIGRGPTSGAWERYLERHGDAEHWVITEHGWPDAVSTADHLVWGGMGEVLNSLRHVVEVDSPGELAPDSPEQRWRENPWLRSWLDADRRARQALDQVLAATPGLSEGAVARTVAEGLSDGALLVVGNSLPIRQLDLWVPGHGPWLRVASQRGTSGIDGVVSGAAGSALVHDGPAALLVGDVSFLHDLSGLATVRRVRTPLALVVVQNRGGRIFEQLPVARHPIITQAEEGGRLDHWLTPHDADFEHAARLHHLPFLRVRTLAELEAALAQALSHPGATLIEAMVPEQGAARQIAALGERLARALESWQPPPADETHRR